MAYRKTRRSKETLARMRAGKDAARMERPAPERVPELPELRRRIIIENFDFGHDVHVMELCKVFGWSNPAMAMVYFNPKAADIAKRIG